MNVKEAIRTLRSLPAGGDFRVTISISMGDSVKPEGNADLEVGIESLGLPKRTESAIRSLNIETVADLVQITEVEFLKQNAVGLRSLRQVKKALEDKYPGDCITLGMRL